MFSFLLAPVTEAPKPTTVPVTTAPGSTAVVTTAGPTVVTTAAPSVGPTKAPPVPEEEGDVENSANNTRNMNGKLCTI